MISYFDWKSINHDNSGTVTITITFITSHLFTCWLSAAMTTGVTDPIGRTPWLCSRPRTTESLGRTTSVSSSPSPPVFRRPGPIHRHVVLSNPQTRALWRHPARRGSYPETPAARWCWVGGLLRRSARPVPPCSERGIPQWWMGWSSQSIWPVGCLRSTRRDITRGGPVAPVAEKWDALRAPSLQRNSGLDKSVQKPSRPALL